MSGIKKYLKSVTAKNISKSTVGYIAILVAAILASLLDIVGKPLVDSQYTESAINPIFLALFIYVIIGIFFTPFAKKTASSIDFTKRNVLIMCGIGVVEVAAIATNFFGLSHTNATNASIISNSEIVFGVFLALIIFKEKIHKSDLVPFFMIISGGNDCSNYL